MAKRFILYMGFFSLSLSHKIWVSFSNYRILSIDKTILWQLLNLISNLYILKPA